MDELTRAAAAAAPDVAKGLRQLADSVDGACPEASRHTPQPKGYMAWHAWAQRKSRTHHQVRCPGCGRYEIWVAGRPDPVPIRQAGRERRLIEAAKLVAATGHGNLRQPRYADRQEAFDRLRDALTEYGQ